MQANQESSDSTGENHLEGSTEGSTAQQALGSAGAEHDSHPVQELGKKILDAAVQAEYQTGEEEQSEAEARRHVGIRIARIIGGFVVVGIGIAALPLPGPGWVLIILGLSLLPFTWAERTIRLIRRSIPGIPEDGKISTITWVVMGGLLIATTAVSVLFGAEITNWIVGFWDK